MRCRHSFLCICPLLLGTSDQCFSAVASLFPHPNTKKTAVPFGVSTGCLTVRRVKWVQPFRPAHNLIRPPPRSFLPCRRRIHNSVVHQRRSPLPCRRSILLRRSASLHRSRTAAPGRARGLALLRNRQRCLRGLSFIFFFLSGFSFFPCFSLFSSRHLVFVPKKI